MLWHAIVIKTAAQLGKPGLVVTQRQDKFMFWVDSTVLSTGEAWGGVRVMVASARHSVSAFYANAPQT